MEILKLLEKDVVNADAVPTWNREELDLPANWTQRMRDEFALVAWAREPNPALRNLEMTPIDLDGNALKNTNGAASGAAGERIHMVEAAVPGMCLDFTLGQNA